MDSSRDDRRISAVIPSWNTKDHLFRCISSLLERTRRHEVEIVVVDNASTDGSVEMVERQFPGARVVQNSANLGFAYACNRGMEAATGSYYALVNSDVVVEPLCMDLLCEYLSDHPRVGLVGPRVVYPDGSLQYTTRRFPTLWNSYCRALGLDKLLPGSRVFAQQFMTYSSHDGISSVDFLSGCLVMARSEAVGAVGGLDERYFMFAEDKDWGRQFWKSGYTVVYFPAAVAVHHHFASAAKDPVRFYVEEIRANLQYWRKHHGRFREMLYYASVLLHQATRMLVEGAGRLAGVKRTDRTGDRFRRSVEATKWLLGVALRPARIGTQFWDRRTGGKRARRPSSRRRCKGTP